MSDKYFVVLQPWLGTLARGNVVAEADLPGEAKAHLADGAIRVATKEEREGGVDWSTLPPTEAEKEAAAQEKAIAASVKASEEAHPQKMPPNILPAVPEKAAAKVEGVNTNG